MVEKFDEFLSSLRSLKSFADRHRWSVQRADWDNLVANFFYDNVSVLIVLSQYLTQLAHWKLEGDKSDFSSTYDHHDVARRLNQSYINDNNRCLNTHHSSPTNFNVALLPNRWCLIPCHADGLFCVFHQPKHIRQTIMRLYAWRCLCGALQTRSLADGRNKKKT